MLESSTLYTQVHTRIHSNSNFDIKVNKVVGDFFFRLQKQPHLMDFLLYWKSSARRIVVIAHAQCPSPETRG